MDFKTKLSTWATGREPPDSLKESGFQAGYKPPASYFNWFWNLVLAGLKELQESLSTLEETLTKKIDDKHDYKLVVSDTKPTEEWPLLWFKIDPEPVEQPEGVVFELGELGDSTIKALVDGQMYDVTNAELNGTATADKYSIVITEE